MRTKALRCATHRKQAICKDKQSTVKYIHNKLQSNTRRTKRRYESE